MKKHMFIFLGVLIAFSFILPYTTFAADSYKVGALFSVTGRTSFLGDPEKKTALMVADQQRKFHVWRQACPRLRVVSGIPGCVASCGACVWASSQASSGVGTAVPQ